MEENARLSCERIDLYYAEDEHHAFWETATPHPGRGWSSNWLILRPFGATLWTIYRNWQMVAHPQQTRALRRKYGPHSASPVRGTSAEAAATVLRQVFPLNLVLNREQLHPWRGNRATVIPLPPEEIPA